MASNKGERLSETRICRKTQRKNNSEYFQKGF